MSKNIIKNEESPSWKYDDKIKQWSFEDKFISIIQSQKPIMPVVELSGTTQLLIPVHSENSGKKICWRTTVPINCNDNIFPAFYSLDEISKMNYIKGNINMMQFNKEYISKKFQNK